MKNKQPKTARWILSKFSVYEEMFAVTRDLEEEHTEILKNEGKFKSKLWLWLQIFKISVYYINLTISWSFAMFKNYVLIAVRNLKKYKGYSFINIFGLSIAVTCCILVYLFVKNELSYNNFHKNADSIYRAHTLWYTEGTKYNNKSRTLPTPFGPTLLAEFSEIEYINRFKDLNVIVSLKDKMYKERITLTDKNIFKMFTFPLLEGDFKTALKEKHSIVLSEGMADKYFGNNNPIGEVLTVKYLRYKIDYIVTAVSKSTPSNSTIQFDFLIPFDNADYVRSESLLENWGSFWISTYVQFKSGKTPEHIINLMPGFTSNHFASFIEIWKNYGYWKEDGNPMGFSFDPIKKIHLDTLIFGASNPKKSYILSFIAIFILFIACINFTNISIGKSITRFKEIGIRKVLGANKSQLGKQFLIESYLMSFLALISGILLAYILLPVFNQLTGKELSLNFISNLENMFAFLILTGILGFTAGGYPALILSGFQPVKILQGKLKIGKNNLFTRTLIIVQFSLSLLLISSTLILSKQLNFMLTKDLGFNKENVIVIRTGLNFTNSESTLEYFKNKLSSHKEIVKISGSSESLGLSISSSLVDFEDRNITIFDTKVDYDYIETMDLELMKGRNFSREITSDLTDAVIVNEALVREYNWDDPIGKRVKGFRDAPIPDPIVIGVLKNFHNLSLRRKISPALYFLNPRWSIRYILVRIKPSNVSDTIKLLENTWKETVFDTPFSYSFLDEDVDTQYRNEQRWNSILRYSSIIAILIACLGVFGLTSLAVTRRTKEIGIRKVLGANIPDVINLLSKEFIFLVLLANVIILPAGYYIMEKFLQNYPYRVNQSIWDFLITGFITLLIVFVTAGTQALKAARANPVNSLRNE